MLAPTSPHHGRRADKRPRTSFAALQGTDYSSAFRDIATVTALVEPFLANNV
jgi:hypothetical protein